MQHLEQIFEMQKTMDSANLREHLLEQQKLIKEQIYLFEVNSFIDLTTKFLNESNVSIAKILFEVKQSQTWGVYYSYDFLNRNNVIIEDPTKYFRDKVPTLVYKKFTNGCDKQLRDLSEFDPAAMRTKAPIILSLKEDITEPLREFFYTKEMLDVYNYVKLRDETIGKTSNNTDIKRPKV